MLYKVFYSLYCLIGLVIFVTFLYLLIFIVPILDKFQWVPNFIREVIADSNDWLAYGYEHSVFSLSEQFIRVLISCAFICAIILGFAYYNKKLHAEKAQEEEKSECIPISSNEKERCMLLIDGVQISMKKDIVAITAFAYGSEIVISQGALDKCSDMELIGLIAHELGHVKSKDSFFRKKALQARMYYLTIYEIIKLIINTFWGIILRYILFFCSLPIFLWGRSENGNEKLSNIVIATILITSVLANWVGQKILRIDVNWFTKCFKKIERELCKLTLTIIKFFLYALPIGWLLVKGNDLTEYNADKYAIKLGYGEQLLKALRHIQEDDETKLKLHAMFLLNKRIHKLIKSI